MRLSVTIGLLFSIVSLSNLVVGDPLSVIIFNSVKTTNNPNDYFGTIEVDVLEGKKNPLVNIKLPTKKELPPTMQMKLTFIGPDSQDPFVYVISLCDAIADPLIGSTFSKAGQPKNLYPKACPFGAGDWSIVKWKPPVEKIPPFVPDGKFSASIMLMEEGKPPCVQIDVEGTLSHDVPGFGR